MSDLLIYDLDPEMRRSLEASALAHDRDISQEAKARLRKSLGLPEAETENMVGPPPGVKLGTWLFSLIPPEHRVDLNWDIPGSDRDPPDFT